MYKFLVTATHPVKKWACTDHPFFVKTDTRGDMTMYYAVAEKYGCGKSYWTPKEAITCMLHEHACHVVSIKEA